ncbi:MAG: hypothetical protein RIS90_2013, partial [Pseudomonadota bacterium]
MLNRLGLALMHGLARLPLPWLRALGALLGLLLYVLAVPRRRVARTILGLCFPGLSAPERRDLTRRSCVRCAQAWLDRAWRWPGTPARGRPRLRLSG